METIAKSGLEVYPLSVEHYDQMVAPGVLDEDDKVELLRGVLSVELDELFVRLRRPVERART